MKKKLWWAVLAAALAVPALGYAAGTGRLVASWCPLCDHCPLSR